MLDIYLFYLGVELACMQTTCPHIKVLTADMNAMNGIFEKVIQQKHLQMQLQLLALMTQNAIV